MVSKRVCFHCAYIYECLRRKVNVEQFLYMSKLHVLICTFMCSFEQNVGRNTISARSTGLSDAIFNIDSSSRHLSMDHLDEEAVKEDVLGRSHDLIGLNDERMNPKRNENTDRDAIELSSSSDTTGKIITNLNGNTISRVLTPLINLTLYTYNNES